MTNSLLRSRRPAHGFTLVELLVVIAIIGILASMTLFAMYETRESAKASRTRTQVMKINELLMNRWEDYRYRSVAVSIPFGTDPRTAGRLRLDGLRELMRMELPDRKSDLLDPPVVLATPNGVPAPPSLWLAYRRKADAQIRAFHGPAGDWTSDAYWSPTFANAECLYLILATIRDGDTTGLDAFHESEIGDADQDGMFEIRDGWGTPIAFLRWAPGFRSDLQRGDVEPAQDGNAGPYPDPFDLMKIDPRWTDGIPDNDPFVLQPLVYSAGPDKLFDICDDLPVPPTNRLRYAQTALLIPPGVANDPYFTINVPPILQIGQQADVDGDGVLSFRDNLTSHFIEVKSQ